MTSKQFSQHLCVYCQQRASTPTGDHIFARQFFLPRDRANLPKAPCCAACGTEKSRDEHYLTAVLPFGGRHLSAHENLTGMVPGRLAKNARLHRELASRQVSSADGKPMVLPLDTSRVESLFRRITIGLLWHSWGVYLPRTHEVQCGLLTSTGEAFMSRVFDMRAVRRIQERLGDGTFKYVGAQGAGDDAFSVWRYEIYGELQMTDDREAPDAISRSVGCITGRSETLEKYPFK